MAKRKRNWATRQNEEFKEFIRSKCKLDENTGEIKFNDVYVSLYVTIGFKSNSIAIPYSHLVWFLKNNRWPNSELHLDHIDDNSWNNKPENLQEITIKENQFKKRGRKVNSNYGTGKYTHGLHLTEVKNGALELFRYFSRGQTKTNKTIKHYIGTFHSVEEAEKYITELTKELESGKDVFSEFFVEDENLD